MCVGTPAQIISVEGLVALAQNRYGQESLDLSLTGALAPGDYVLSYLGVAVRTLTQTEAHDIDRALQAVVLAQSGQPFEHLLEDLIARSPQLPPHLQNDIDHTTPRDGVGEGERHV